MPADETPKTAIWGSKSETPWIELTFEDDAGARDRERVGELEAEVASLRQQLDDARTQAENASVDAFAYQDGARGFYEDATALRSQLAAAEADRDRLLVVYRAAEAWRAMRAGSPTRPKPESATLIAAVDSYRAGTPAEAPLLDRAQRVPGTETERAGSADALRLIDPVTGGGIRAQDFSAPLDDEAPAEAGPRTRVCPPECDWHTTPGDVPSSAPVDGPGPTAAEAPDGERA